LLAWTRAHLPPASYEVYYHTNRSVITAFPPKHVFFSLQKSERAHTQYILGTVQSYGLGYGVIDNAIIAGRWGSPALPDLRSPECSLCCASVWAERGRQPDLDRDRTLGA